MDFKRHFALFLALILGFSPLSMAEPYSEAPGTPAAPVSGASSEGAGTPVGNASSLKEPLIEVSVDALEISETGTKDLGFLWNPRLTFTERTIPGIFKIGEIERITPLSATLNLLLQNGQARALANPTLITKSKFEATFSVGGEIPYPQVGQGGVTGVEFKKYGVILKILPEITPRKTIDAQINFTVSDIDESRGREINGDFQPALSARDAGSKVEIEDGETLVLAGIKQSKRRKTVRKVPILGSIPLLGLLFRNTFETTDQTSLVVFVTFRLIKS